MKRYYDLVRRDPVWSRIIGYSLVVLLIRLADAIVSFWAPSLIQHSLNNSFLTGLVISFQSVVGLGADIVFPSLLRKSTVKKLTIITILMSALTFIFLYVSSLRPYVIFFLISMFIWGIYYEVAGFGIYQLVDSVATRETRSGAWGIVGTFVSLAYFLGPFIAVWLLIKGNIYLLGFGLIILLISFTLFTFKNRMQERNLDVNIADINLAKELRFWLILLKTIWPLILITLVMNFIDSTFWTTGVIWTTKLALVNPLGSLLLSFYILPSLFMGFVVAKWGIYKGKKKFAVKFLIISGIFLSTLFLHDNIVTILMTVLISSIALSIAGPLVAGAYSDIVARLGTEKKHLIGFSSATANISYIITPPIAGLISDRVGEKSTFGYIGIITLVVSIFLLFIMPKKLKLRELEIDGWEK